MTELIYWLLIGITIAGFLFGKWLSWLNETYKSPELPAEAEGIYDEDRYAKWLQYDKANGQLGVIASAVNIIGALLMLVFGLFGWLDQWLRQFIEHPVLLALAFFAVLGTASSIISAPFGIYGTFVIEERFGFNKTTWKTYAMDAIKGLMLTMLIGAPISATIVWIYYQFTDDFWWMAWAVISGFSLLMAMFGASLIMPLFNKFTPLEAGELRDAIEAYCKKVGFKINNLYVMDGSKRSGKSNAFFTGLGPRKKIVLFDTLIDQMTVEEIVAVLAHEVGHYKKKHTAQGLILGVVQTGLMLFLLGWVLRIEAVSLALGAGQGSFHVGIIAFGILYTPLSMMMGIGMNVLSRKNEYEADAYAAETYRAAPLISGLKKLTAENLSNLKPHPWFAFVNYSHPPVLLRIKELKKF